MLLFGSLTLLAFVTATRALASRTVEPTPVDANR
jgi:hypothetical protein